MSIDDLVTHAVITGMTGSGKTGLLMVLVEEALRAQIPVLLVDIKGDLPNLKLAFPSFDATMMQPWIEAERGDEDGIADPPVVEAVVQKRKRELAKWSISETELAELAKSTHVRIITPGSDAGESLHLLSALERRSDRWDDDLDGARATLSAAVSLVLRLIGRDPEPGKSREHALLSVLAVRRLEAGSPADLGSLIPDVLEPGLESIGALPVDQYMSPGRRCELAADLNNLIASPAFANWRQGQDLDVGRWMAPVDGKTPATIISVAHLDDEARLLVLGVVLEETLTWVRSLPGTARLRALIVFDEVFGFIPPHPKSPPTKRPMVALMKQARAYGVGCVVATQNPMDLDYRALSNAGTWMLGRLQTDADRSRVVEGLGEDKKKSPVAALLKRISSRWFVVRDTKGELSLLNPRWAMSYLKGPMTSQEIRKVREGSASEDESKVVEGAEEPVTSRSS
ncbi:MAG: DUF853 family protein [Deltaproteobacteria bacterium]|nr:DUF853 family protein [Deltaproteobacteria bacterium]